MSQEYRVIQIINGWTVISVFSKDGMSLKECLNSLLQVKSQLEYVKKSA